MGRKQGKPGQQRDGIVQGADTGGQDAGLDTADPLVVDLDACADLDLSLVGGKASNLARLRAAGFDVPPGFVVTTAAHKALLAGNEEAVWGGVLEAWHRSAWPAAAVRSSAVLEDHEGLSFAGQFETVLDVVGDEPLVRAVEKVVASAASDRVADYLREMLPETDTRRLFCAAVIQPMVEATVGGVAFTTDPATDTTDRLVIECAPGGAEAVVSGDVRPERHVVGRPDLREIDERRSDAGRILATDRVRIVAETAVEIERLFGSPQDVEWALDDGDLWILQARPITARAPGRNEVVIERELARLRRRHGGEPSVWANIFAAELIPEPTRATLELGWQAVEPDGGVLTERHLDIGLPRSRHGLTIDVICARLYFDLFSLNPILRDWGVPVRIAPPTADSWWAGLDRTWIKIDWKQLWRLPRFLRCLPRIVGRVRRLVRRGAEQFSIEDLPAIEAEVARVAALDLAGLGDPELLTELDSVRTWLAGSGRRIWERGAHSALISYRRLAGATRILLGDSHQEIASALVRGAPGNATLEANQAIADLAAVARAHGQDSQEFRRDLGQFLERYGHRSTTELELSEPRWREDPGPVLASVALLAHDRSAEPVRQLPETEVDAAPEGIPAGAGRLRRRLLRPYVAGARRNQFLRETPKFHYLRVCAQLRDIYLEVGRRAEARGNLRCTDDVFHLCREELPDVLDGRNRQDLAEVAERRREERDVLRRQPLPPVLSLPDVGAILTAAPHLRADTGKVLRGDPVSAGVASGYARVVHDPNDVGALGAEAVLVAPRTDPAWTTIFRGVRAVVVEAGSTISHAAIIAREYSLPMVVNVPNATQRLTDGARVTVDGTAGTVRVVDLPPE